MATGRSLHIGSNSVDPDHYDGWSGELSGCVNDALDLDAMAYSQGFVRRTLLNEHSQAPQPALSLDNEQRMPRITIRFRTSYPALKTHGSVFKFPYDPAEPPKYGSLEVAGGDGKTKRYQKGRYSYRFFYSGFDGVDSFVLEAVDGDEQVVGEREIKNVNKNHSRVLIFKV